MQKISNPNNTIQILILKYSFWDFRTLAKTKKKQKITKLEKMTENSFNASINYCLLS